MLVAVSNKHAHILDFRSHKVLTSSKPLKHIDYNFKATILKWIIKLHCKYLFTFEPTYEHKFSRHAIFFADNHKY